MSKPDGLSLRSIRSNSVPRAAQHTGNEAGNTLRTRKGYSATGKAEVVVFEVQDIRIKNSLLFGRCFELKGGGRYHLY
jgi:hypothetical protein